MNYREGSSGRDDEDWAWDLNNGHNTGGGHSGGDRGGSGHENNRRHDTADEESHDSGHHNKRQGNRQDRDGDSKTASGHSDPARTGSGRDSTGKRQGSAAGSSENTGGASGELPGLGDTRDPTVLIPGNVAQLEELARALSQDSVTSEELATRIYHVRDGYWSGPASDRFHQRITVLVRFLREHSDVAANVAKAIKAYAGAIVTARGTAGEAVANADAAERLARQVQEADQRGASVSEQVQRSVVDAYNNALGFLADARATRVQAIRDLTRAVGTARSKLGDALHKLPDHHPGELTPDAPWGADVKGAPHSFGTGAPTTHLNAAPAPPPPVVAFGAPPAPAVPPPTPPPPSAPPAAPHTSAPPIGSPPTAGPASRSPSTLPSSAADGSDTHHRVGNSPTYSESSGNNGGSSNAFGNNGFSTNGNSGFGNNGLGPNPTPNMPNMTPPGWNPPTPSPANRPPWTPLSQENPWKASPCPPTPPQSAPGPGQRPPWEQYLRPAPPLALPAAPTPVPPAPVVPPAPLVPNPAPTAGPSNAPWTQPLHSHGGHDAPNAGLSTDTTPNSPAPHNSALDNPAPANPAQPVPPGGVPGAGAHPGERGPTILPPGQPQPPIDSGGAQSAPAQRSGPDWSEPTPTAGTGDTTPPQAPPPGKGHDMGKWGLFGTGLAAGVTAGVGGTYLAQSRTNLSNTTNGTTTDQRTGADTSGQSDKGADQQPPPTPPDVAHLSRRLFNATQDVWEEQRQADTSKAPTPPRHPLQARHLAHPFRRHNPTENTGPAGPSSGNGLSADDEVESGPTASSGDTTTSTVGMKIGYRGQNDSILDLAATAGISLLGPRGVDVARAIAATLIMGGDSRGFGWMVITRAHAVAMLGTLDTTRLPTGIVIVDDLEDAITTMDRQISVRFNAPEHTNWPMTLFILNHPVLDEDTRELLTDFLTDGQTVGVTALILGPDPLGDTITTDLHGTVISTCGDALAHLDGARLFHMPTEGAFPVFSQLTWTTPAPLPETTDTDRDTDEEDEPISTSHTGDVQDAPVANLALTARENDAVADDRASQNGTAQLSRVAVSITAALEPPAHTTPQTAPAAARAPHQPGPAAEPERTEPDETNSTHEDADEPTAGLPSTNRAAAHDTDDDTHDAHQDDAGDDAAIDGHEPSPPPTTTGMLRLEILGGAVALSLVSEHDQAARTPIVIPDGGRIAQYLTHVALERNGIRKEQLAESLWPEAKNPVASLNQTNSELRKTVRKAIGPGYETLMNATSKSCQLNSKLLTVDYWELLDAGTPTQDSATLLLQVARFRATLADYHGALGRGIDAEWIETYREDVRRQAMTTTNNLTDQLIDNDQVSLAIALLHQTRNFAHYNESLYLKIIRLEQQLGRNEAAVNTYKLLEEKLQEIGAEPMKSTENLACGKR